MVNTSSNVLIAAIITVAAVLIVVGVVLYAASQTPDPICGDSICEISERTTCETDCGPIKECDINTDCNETHFCSNDYKCLDRECESDSECTAGTCESYQCVPYECVSDSDCGALELCQSNECVAVECKQDTDCDTGFECASNECVEKVNEYDLKISTLSFLEFSRTGDTATYEVEITNAGTSDIRTPFTLKTELLADNSYVDRCIKEIRTLDAGETKTISCDFDIADQYDDIATGDRIKIDIEATIDDLDDIEETDENNNDDTLDDGKWTLQSFPLDLEISNITFSGFTADNSSAFFTIGVENTGSGELDGDFRIECTLDASGYTDKRDRVSLNNIVLGPGETTNVDCEIPVTQITSAITAGTDPSVIVTLTAEVDIDDDIDEVKETNNDDYDRFTWDETELTSNIYA